jgi:hypothetical protein
MKTQGWMYPVAGLAVAGSGYLVYSHYFRRTPADVVTGIDGAPDGSMAVVVSYKSGPPDTITLASFNIPVSQAQLEQAGPLAFLRGALIGKTRGDVDQLVSPSVTSGVGTGLAVGAGITVLLALALAFPIGGGIVGYSFSKPGHKLGGTALGVLGGMVAASVLGALTSGGGAAAAVPTAGASAASAPGPAQVTPGLVGAPAVGRAGPHFELRDPSLAATPNQYPGGEWKYQITGRSGHPVMAARYTPGGMGLRAQPQTSPAPISIPPFPNVTPAQTYNPPMRPPPVYAAPPRAVPGERHGPLANWPQVARPTEFPGKRHATRGDSFVAASPYYHPLGGHMARSVAVSQASAPRRW